MSFPPLLVDPLDSRWLQGGSHGGKPYAIGIDRSVELETAGVTYPVISTTHKFMVAGHFQIVANEAGIERLISQDGSWFIGYDHDTKELLMSVQCEPVGGYPAPPTELTQRWYLPLTSLRPTYLAISYLPPPDPSVFDTHAFDLKTINANYSGDGWYASSPRVVGTKLRLGGGLSFGGNYGKTFGIAIHENYSLLPSAYGNRAASAKYWYPMLGGTVGSRRNAAPTGEDHNLIEAI